MPELGFEGLNSLNNNSLNTVFGVDAFVCGFTASGHLARWETTISGVNVKRAFARCVSSINQLHTCIFINEHCLGWWCDTGHSQLNVYSRVKLNVFVCGFTAFGHLARWEPTISGVNVKLAFARCVSLA